jgi:hypothetical protein
MPCRFWLADFGANGLIIDRLTGNVLANAVLAFCVLRGEARSIFGSVEAKKMKALAREHSAFPKYNLPRAIMNITSRKVPVRIQGILAELHLEQINRVHAYLGHYYTARWEETATALAKT